jgi:hypothetical protein
LTMRWSMQVASMGNSRCAESVPDRNSPIERRPLESNRMWLRDSLHWVERHQDLPTGPDFDPSRTGGRGRFSPAASRSALLCAACPRMPITEGQGLGRRLHMSEHARRARRRRSGSVLTVT